MARFFVAGALIVGLLGGLLLVRPTQAATGINEQLNFQGRLLNAAGAVVADGTYNMEFKIYCGGNGVPGATVDADCTHSTDEDLLWTESRLNNDTNGVTVKNGYFSVNLGSVTAFASNVNWNEDEIWLSVNIGSTNGTCTPFSNCTPDGEMNPMKRLSSTPYALNTKYLGGLQASAFGQLAANNTWSGTNALQNTSTTALVVQKATAGDVALTVNTTNNRVVIGNATGTDTDTTTLILDSATADPTTALVEGAMYYNSNTDKFRCYQSSAWTDCIGAGGTTTLSGAYTNGSAGDQVITLSTANDSIILRNPASSGSDSTYILTLDQLSTGAYGGLSIDSAGTGNLLKITDTTATARDVFTIADGGLTVFRTQTDSATGFQVLDADGGTPVLNVDTDNERVGIGDASPGAALEIASAITDIPGLKISGPQTVDSSPMGLVDFSSTIHTSVATVSILRTNAKFNPTTAISGVLYGINNVVNVGGTSSNNITTVVGNLSRLTEADATYTGTVANFHGFRVDNATGSPTLTNQVGLYVQDLTVGTNNAGLAIGEATGTNSANLILGSTSIPSGTWSIYNSSSDNNAIAGNTRIGSTTAPSNALDVTGTATVSGLVKVGDGSGNDYLEFSEEAGNPTCGAGLYAIWANSSDTKLKKCENGSLSDLSSGGGVTADSLNFTEFSDALVLDASTSIGFGASTYGLTFNNDGSGNFAINLTSTGDFVINDGVADAFRVEDTGTVTVGSDTGAITIDPGASAAVTITAHAASTWSTDSGALSLDSAAAINIGNTNTTSISLCNSATCDTVEIGTNADADTLTIGDTSGLDTVAIKSTGWSVTGAGALTVASCSGCAGSLQAAYNAGATIETAGGIPLLITETTAAAHTLDLLQLTGNPATSGTFAGDLLQLTMDAVDANAFTGHGLKIVVDVSQIGNGGLPLTIEEDTGAELFGVNKYGFARSVRGFVSYDGYLGQEFNDEKAAITADNTAYGDNSTWVADEQGTCSWTVPEAVPSASTGVQTASGGCWVFAGLGAGDMMQFTNAVNRPRTLIKLKPSLASSTKNTWAGLFIDAAAGNAEPGEGIYMTNAGGTTWTGRVNPASGGNTDVTCTGVSVSTSQFALLEIIVESSTVVRFKVDADLSDGINFTDCGTANPSGVTSNLGVGVLQGSSDTTSYTMYIDYVRVWTDDPPDGGSQAPLMQQAETPFDPVTGADLAEGYLVDDPESFLGGELVSADENQPGAARLSSRKYDPGLIGVMSPSPHTVMGQQNSRSIPVALSGRVPIKVSDENGPVQVGDALTASSTPGVAMKATEPGWIIGSALAPHANGEGVIMAFINRSWYSPVDITKLSFGSVAFDVNEDGLMLIGGGLAIRPSQTGTSAALSVKDIAGQDVAAIDNLGNANFAGTITANKIKANQIEGIEVLAGRIAGLESAELLGGNENQSSNPVSSEIAPPNISQLKFDSPVTALSLTVLEGLEIKGGLVVAGSANFSGEVSFSTLVKFLGTTSFAGPVSFDKHVLFGSDAGGRAVIKKGDSKVEIKFSESYEKKPLISANYLFDNTQKADGGVDTIEDKLARRILGGYSFGVGEMTEKGFIIFLNKPADEDTPFYWLAIQTNNDSVTYSSP